MQYIYIHNYLFVSIRYSFKKELLIIRDFFMGFTDFYNNHTECCNAFASTSATGPERCRLFLSKKTQERFNLNINFFEFLRELPYSYCFYSCLFLFVLFLKFCSLMLLYWAVCLCLPCLIIQHFGLLLLKIFYTLVCTGNNLDIFLFLVNRN